MKAPIVVMVTSVLFAGPLRAQDALRAGDVGAVTPSEAARTAWTFRTGGPIYATPVLDGGTLYVGSGDGNLYAVDAETGAERWRFATGGAVDAAAAIADGVVFALSRAGVLHAVDARTGALRWAFRTGDPPRGSANIFGS